MAATEEKFVDLLIRLAMKTKAGQVRWLKSSKGFRVQITPDSEIEISLLQSDVNPDYLKATLRNGIEAAVVVSAEEGEPIRPGQKRSRYVLLLNLYKSVYNSYHGVDSTLSALEKLLEGDSVIGEAETPTTDSGLF